MEKGSKAAYCSDFRVWQIDRDYKRLMGIAAEQVRVVLETARRHSDQISEDSYASRIEAQNIVTFLTRFNQRIAKAAPGRVVDLRQTIDDYGYDPEAAAADRSCGLKYVSEADRKESDYHLNISRVSGLINRLKIAGVRVAVGITRVVPDEEFDD